jgi:enterobactin synthetase component D
MAGSITHSSDVAIVALADCRESGLLGIDFETWLDHDAAQSVGISVLDCGERSVLASGGWPSSRAWTLAFSAKESVFKALYPKVGFYFDFDQVGLHSVDWQRRRFSVVMRKSLSETVRAGQQFNGVFRLMAGGIFTVVADLSPSTSDMALRLQPRLGGIQ